jgi:hypothetical protein
LGSFGVALNRQIGLPRPTFNGRRETQPNFVISQRTDSLIPPNGRLASAACTFKHMHVFVVNSVNFLPNVVISPSSAFYLSNKFCHIPVRHWRAPRFVVGSCFAGLETTSSHKHLHAHLHDFSGLESSSSRAWVASIRSLKHRRSLACG